MAYGSPCEFRKIFQKNLGGGLFLVFVFSKKKFQKKFLNL